MLWLSFLWVHNENSHADEMAAYIESLTAPIHTSTLNTLRPEQYGWHFVDISRCIFMDENCHILIPIWLNDPSDSKSVLVQIMAWYCVGVKPLPWLPKPIVTVMNINATKPACVNGLKYPDTNVHGANMGPIWGHQDPGGPHVGPMNLAIWVY